MKSLHSAILVAMALAFGGCISGPKESNRTMADNLNNENYKHFGHVAIVPYGETKPVQRKISGTVFCEQGALANPLNNATVSLQKQGQVIASTSTTADGKYSVRGRIDAVGNYAIVVKSSCGEKSMSIPAGLAKELRGQDIYLGR